MPRSRGSELPQRQSPRGPLSVRASSSDSDSLHHHHHQRPVVDRSPKVGLVSERRSPRSSQSDSLQQKKLGTRIAGLETQLGQAQEELKKLKDQLASAETAKKEAQAELEKKAQKPVVEEIPKEDDQPPSALEEIHEPSPSSSSSSSSNEKNPSDPDDQSTDVFEIPVETKAQPDPQIGFKEEDETRETQVKNSAEPPAPPTPTQQEPEKPPPDNSALLKEEINSLIEKLKEKEKELEMSREENERLKKQAKEAGVKAASALTKEEESALKLAKAGEELEESKINLLRLNEKLEEVEEAKALLETEMKKMKVQTEQWRKAADAAAAILSAGAGVEMNERRVAERCGSMDKYMGNGFGAAEGFGGLVGSPLVADDLDDRFGFGSGKRKGGGGGGMRFSDLWKKKGQK